VVVTVAVVVVVGGVGVVVVIAGVAVVVVVGSVGVVVLISAEVVWTFSTSTLRHPNHPCSPREIPCRPYRLASG
jgi:hypothetical protein